MTEQFQPISNTPPAGFAGKLKFYGRMLLDLQLLTIYKDLKKRLPLFTGKVLDVGCGQSPYKFLLNKNKTRYFGIDVVESDQFGYDNPDVISFDGKNIPFGNDEFDAVICTEVLEHVFHFQKLVDEMYRVSKANATLVITVPWSARNHYIQWDFFRYTPSTLAKMFSAFKEVSIKPRGTDIVSMCAKFIVLFFRNVIPAKAISYLFLPIWIAVLPFFILVVFIAHFALWLNLGSTEDPLGYTIILKK